MLPANGQGQNLYLGRLAPDVATVDRMVRDRMAYTDDALLVFEDYCEAVERLPQLIREIQRRGLDGVVISPAVRGLINLSDSQRFTPDFEGWMRYLSTQGPIEHAMQHPRYQRQAAFPERGLAESVLVVGPRGWGKSELLKALIHHHVKPPFHANHRAAVVVLDPGGDLAMQIARWPELSGPSGARDRLVYVEPELRPGYTVGFNPLDGTGLDHRSRSHVAGMLVEAIGMLIADLSLAMRNLIRACCTVLLGIPGATLRELQSMLRNPQHDPSAACLYASACAYADSADVREFFQHRFMSEAYRGTKEYLLNRLDEVMLIHDLMGMFGGTASVNLREAVEAQKVVLVNLAKFENEEDQRFAGRLLATMVIAIARRRAQTPHAPRPPINLVIDEATVLAGNELVRGLAQLRKFGLNLILAQQVMGSNFSAEDRKTLVENTGCKFIGGRDRRLVADMLTNGRDFADKLPAISPRTFWAEWAGDGPHKLEVRDDLTADQHTVTDWEWSAYVNTATGMGGYYRSAVVERHVFIEPSNHDTMESTNHAPMESGPTTSTTDDDVAPPPLASASLGLRKPKAAGMVIPPTPAPRSRAAAKGVELVAEKPKAPRILKKKPKETPIKNDGTPNVRTSHRELD